MTDNSPQLTLDTIADHLPVLVAYLDREHRYRYVNHTYEQWYGRPRQQIVGRHARELLGEAAYAAIRPRIERALAGERVSFEAPHDYQDGTHRLLRVDYAPDWKDGEVCGLVSHIADISELRQAEAALHLKEQAITHARNGMAMSDLEGRLVYVNPACMRMWGYTDESQVLGRPATAFWVEPEAAAAVIAALMRDRQWCGALEALRADGSHFLAGLNAALIPDVQGRPAHMVASFEDVTQREEIFEQVEMFQRIAESTGQGIGFSDLDATVRYFNPALRRMLAIPDGADITRFAFNDFYTDQQREIQQREILPVVRTQGHWTGEVDLRALDGRTVPTLHNALLIRCPDGTPRAYANVITDLTERKREQQQLREERNFNNAVLDNASALVVVLDREGRIRRFNRACEELSRYAFSEVEGRCVWDFLLPPEERDVVREQAFLALAENPQVRAGSHTNHWVAKDGDKRLIDWHNTLLLDERGEMEYLVAIGIDVTEKRMVEAALRRSEETYARAEDIAHIGSWDWDIVSGSLRWTDEIFRILGQAPQAFGATYQAFLDTLHPEDRQRVIDAMNASMADAAVPYDIEHRVVRPDGEVRVVYERGKVYRDDQGKPLRMIGTVHDITEHKQAETRMHAANQVMNAVLDTTPVLIAYLDPEMNIVRVNHAYAAANGKTPTCFVGKSHFELFPSAQNEALFRRVVETGQAYVARAKPFEYRDTPDRGATHWDWALTPIVDVDGRVTGLVLSLLDVSERIQVLEAIQASEDQLKALNENLEVRVAERTAEVQRQSHRNALILDTALDGFFIVNLEGRVCDCNQTYCRMLGYTRDELLDLRISDIEAQEMSEEVEAHIQAVIERGHDRFDTLQRRKDGSTIAVEVSVTRAQIGEESLLFAFAHDISERKQAERSLLAAKEQAERANRAKNEFLSRMSHELRTPMNAILGFAQVLEIQPLGADQREFVEEIHHAGDHLLELINELLDLSRIEAGQLAVAIATVDLGQTLEQAVQLVQPLLSGRQISLVNRCGAALAVLADTTRLRQVLVNLLSNAAKYNRDGGRVAIDCHPTAGERLRITISDTGAGIAPDKLDSLFLPFERLGAEFSAVDGTGIGLALCRQLMQLMHGEIGVESAPGQGSSFWIELPLAGAVVATPSAAAPDAPPAARRTTVLYVEDNAANLKVVEAILRLLPNMTLLSAGNGESGLELARRYHPDVILLDIHLPGMDGYAVLQVLQADAGTRDIPVIALSADAMPLDVERGLKAGFRAYLTKPVLIPDLMAALRAEIPVQSIPA
jgi:PAS domain S-box-containing protein